VTDCERPIQLGVFTVGEKPAPLVYQFTDFDGVIINLTGYTAKFNWQPLDGAAASANASVTLPLEGKAQYTWTGSEFLTPGPYQAQMWVGNGTNRWASVKIRWTVQAGVGNAPAI